MKGLSIFALAACLAIGAAPAAAQQSVDYASVSGRVIDPSGAVVRDAQVTARHTDTNVAGHAATDEEGRFRFRISESGCTRSLSASRDSGIRRNG